MTTNSSTPDLDYFVGRLQPAYDSPGQAKIGHMLDQYGIPFFHKQPVLICAAGRRTIWRPDFTLPTYNSLVIEYDPNRHGASRVADRRTQSDVYRLNGIAALFLERSDLARPNWQKLLYDRLEESYRQPLAHLRDGSPSRQG